MNRLLLCLRASVLCLTAFAACAGAAEAQSRGAEYDTAFAGDIVMVGLEPLLRGYAAAPAGTAFDFGVGVQDAEYDDLFDTGTGSGIVLYLPIFLREAREGFEFALGPLLAIDRITYGGQRDVDAVGDSLKPEDMEVSTFLAGFHVRFRTGAPGTPVRFFGGAHLGLGVGVIDQVDAELNLSGSGGGVFQGTLYDPTSTVAFELQLRPGISFEFHPRVQLNVFLIFGFGIIGAPENNTDASNPIAPADAGPILNGVFGGGLSVSIRFPG